MPDLSTPQAIEARLDAIDKELAIKQNALEDSAMRWFKAKRDREHRFATEYIKAEGTVLERKAKADLESCLIGVEDEAEWEATKAKVRVLETRSTIGMALLKSHGRAGL